MKARGNLEGIIKALTRDEAVEIVSDAIDELVLVIEVAFRAELLNASALRNLKIASRIARERAVDRIRSERRSVSEQ